MNQLKEVILLVSAIISLVRTLVDELEKGIDVVKTGEQKMKILMETVNAALDELEPQTELIKNKVLKIIAKFVEIYVSVKNALGIFKKSE